MNGPFGIFKSVLLVAAFTRAVAAPAETFLTTVTSASDSGTGSLRWAAANAANIPGADTVTFAPGFTGPISVSSDIVINDTDGVTVDATALAGGATVSGSGQAIFTVSEGAGLTLKKLALTGGGSSSGSGGAIDNRGTLSLMHCTLSGHDAPFLGGAIYNQSGTVTLIHCTLSGNSAYHGGAIENMNGTVLLTDCDLSDNIATVGGAIENGDGAATLTQCTLSGNTASSGGGAISNFGAMLLNQCTLSGNSSFATGAINNNGTLTLTQCTLSGNSSENSGGATYNAGGTLALTQCTLSGNSSVFNGGAIYNDLGTVTLTNSIVAGNTATNGADICNDGSIGPSVITRVGANLIQSLVNTNGGTDAGPTATAAAPLLAPLGDYGGSTKTMALLPGSLARNAAATLTQPNTSDQRGFPIVGAPDIGAYEAGTLGADFNAYIFETLPVTTTLAHHAATFDFDGDGVSNHDEWFALTDAGNATSRFSVTLEAISGDTLPISFATALGRTYTIENSTDLATWTPVAGSAFAGTGSTIHTAIGPVNGSARNFVRVRVEP